MSDIEMCITVKVKLLEEERLKFTVVGQSYTHTHTHENTLFVDIMSCVT
jgi:hypothetical protein